MKARISEAPTDQNDRIPPMPGSPQAQAEGPSENGDSSSPSTITERTDAVSEEFAGDLYKIPFQIWHAFNPGVPPEPDPRVVSGVSAPFARVLEKYGLGKIAKDEILVAFYLTQTVFVYVKAGKEAKRSAIIDPERNPAE